MKLVFSYLCSTAAIMSERNDDDEFSLDSSSEEGMGTLSEEQLLGDDMDTETTEKELRKSADIFSGNVAGKLF